MYITFLLAMLDITNHRLQLVNAGHPCPLIRRHDGRIEELGKQGLRTTFSCVFEGFSRELSSNYIINTNCNALYSTITYRKVATM
jgi:hypothetical protein